jgi:hypothetical protein
MVSLHSPGYPFTASSVDKRVASGALVRVDCRHVTGDARWKRHVKAA